MFWREDFKTRRSVLLGFNFNLFLVNQIKADDKFSSTRFFSSGRFPGVSRGILGVSRGHCPPPPQLQWRIYVGAKWAIALPKRKTCGQTYLFALPKKISLNAQKSGV